jgi:hypothetical protein
MRPWYFGNTTVRSPFRLKDGITLLSNSDLEGSLHGQAQEIKFRTLLGEAGIVSLGTDESNSVGRKWRAALSQLGFLYSDKHPQELRDTITPSGKRLAQAESVPAIQECFLRSLVAYRIPSPLEEGYEYTRFSPLFHVLKLLKVLEEIYGADKANITFQEMALIVQLSSPADPLPDISKRIMNYRTARSQAQNKRRFDNEQLNLLQQENGYAPQTYNDYSDLNLRYLKATGLFHASGRGIKVNPVKQFLISKLLETVEEPYSEASYLQTIANGAKLPTDNEQDALRELELLSAELEKNKISFEVKKESLNTPGDIAVVRHDIEQKISDFNEVQFAKQQAQEWKEIDSYLDLIINRSGSATLEDGKEIYVPRSEMPAYFEWALWRAFLAINRIINPPYESRRFKVDQDLLPVGNAPGNGPDLVFEFEDYVLVVEATLTAGSRQEAAEGEPVRRHVAQYLEQYNKPVFGLFVANVIDTNTAETFRSGSWYTRDNTQLSLDILPLTLEQFKEIFEVLFSSDRVDNRYVLHLLRSATKNKNETNAIEWKKIINQTVSDFLKNLTGIDALETEDFTLSF